MKYVLMAIVLSRLLACEGITNHFANKGAHSAKDSTAHMEVPVARDESITTANAYSDLFLDSTAIENYISNNHLSDTVAQHLRNFYNKRNLEFAWMASDGFTEQGRALWNLYDHNNGSGDSLPKAHKAAEKRIDTLMDVDTLHIAANDSTFTNAELFLTQHFLQYLHNGNDTTAAQFAEIRPFIPAKKYPALQLADSLSHQRSDSGTHRLFGQGYYLLRAQLARYDSIQKQGGWPEIPLPTKPLQKGNRAPAITAIKKRLHISGDYRGNDTSQLFTDSLFVAIKHYQKHNGVKADGIVTDSLIAIMNIPVEQRLQQILINMNRMAWMPAPSPDNVVKVNIPDYMLYVYEGADTAFSMPVIVGEEGSNTMLFKGLLNQVVFSPYWNIPASIVKSEILPAMQRNPDYLKQHHMEIVSKGSGVPVIRQLPGPQNALGRVKFLFPNSYDVYLHDTPAKELFSMQNRALSHGCIRLANAEKMADYLLRNNTRWTPEKIRQAMNSDKEQYAELQQPVPVLITYFTAWVDGDGQLNFRKDVYGHDQRTGQKMFANEL